MILGRNIGRSAKLYPDRLAVVEPDGTGLTHRLFAERVWRIADGLIAQGLARGNRVAIVSRNCNDFLCCYFAIGSIGAIMVPLNYGLKHHDLDTRMAHAEVECLLVGTEFTPVVDALSRNTKNALQGRIFVIGGGNNSLYRTFDELVEAGRNRLPDGYVSHDDTLYIGYTSGTTGAPKGAMVSHRSIVSGFLYKAVAYSLTDLDNSINAGPYWHSAPLDFASLAVYLGGTAIIPVQFKAAQFVELIDRYKASNSFVVPTMLQMIASAPEIEQFDISSWRCVVSGGAPLTTAIKKQILQRLGPVLHEFYGATECRSVAYISASDLQHRERSVGRPNRDCEIRILDDEGVDVPNGDIGEIFVRSPGMFNGYYKDPERTRAAFRGDWFSVGDMGRLDDEGFLYLVDRKNDMIITGGENVFPNDIEQVIRRIDGVQEVAVVGLPDEKWGEVVAAFVQLESSASITAESIQASCKAELPPFMIPRRVEFVSALPRTELGKVLRRVLREPYWQQAGASI